MFFFIIQKKYCFELKIEKIRKLGSFVGLFPRTSHEQQLHDITSGFTRLSMKTKYVCHGLILLYGIFLITIGHNKLFFCKILQVDGG